VWNRLGFNEYEYGLESEYKFEVRDKYSFKILARFWFEMREKYSFNYFYGSGSRSGRGTVLGICKVLVRGQGEVHV